VSVWLKSIICVYIGNSSIYYYIVKYGVNRIELFVFAECSPSYFEVVSSKGKLYRRTFSENKKLYPVNPIFYDIIIDGGILDIYTYNRF
jgi:hypothetical protein